ncbi:hypothetical protein CLV24_12530 [Pontibacter ummariensis]|uniref:Uncharacterized protein n=1 Tax=Pontibacter ummariensis TaxID=1610492 RepID=A0A239K1S7_9BACT|nr:hypothetical protein CLV24_12530 [Pontibacter ummariensis]SNT11718.1 hypothetical protein SAMN06296052_12530 [Pontibacter ummariensis]
MIGGAASYLSSSVVMSLVWHFTIEVYPNPLHEV